MKLSLLICLMLMLPGSVLAATALNYYKYAHNNAEYSVMLPEVPRARTIWAEDGNVPYLDQAPARGAIGEVATFRRVDVETEDSFDVRITYLQADSAFLASLTKEKMLAALEKGLQGPPLENKKQGYSAGSNKALKWASISGFSVDKSNRPFYNALHYLTGLESILVIQVRYSIENKVFAEYYHRLASSIIYQPL